MTYTVSTQDFNSNWTQHTFTSADEAFAFVVGFDGAQSIEIEGEEFEGAIPTFEEMEAWLAKQTNDVEVKITGTYEEVVIDGETFFISINSTRSIKAIKEIEADLKEVDYTYRHVKLHCGWTMYIEKSKDRDAYVSVFHDDGRRSEGDGIDNDGFFSPSIHSAIEDALEWYNKNK